MHSEPSARHSVNRRIETSTNNLIKHNVLLEQIMNIVKLLAEPCWQQKARHWAGLFHHSRAWKASIKPPLLF
jgi:hypothetical protein